MNTRSTYSSRARLAVRATFPLAAAGLLSLLAASRAIAQPPPLPQLVDSNLIVRAVVPPLTLVTPTSMAFIGPNDFLVLEKNTGQVKRIINGAVHSTVLDLAVNFGSERGLLGIALHPNFSTNGAVYLYWTKSSTGADTDVLANVDLLGNRVDRFTWNGTTLTVHSDIIQIRARQNDAGQPERGNHDGGVLRFGPDGKLYVYIGDLGRRGQMQNLPDGPGLMGDPAPGAIPMGNQPDDQYGGPEPDNAHLSGVILRLNDDGTAPTDNPFFSAGATRGGEAGANLQKVFAYGIRNGFGMAFDPRSGNLYEAQNGDDTFTEINRVEPGANLGWIQVMGPLSRLAQFKEIETSTQFFGLQQLRWPPTNIADTAQQALARMFMVFDGGDKFGSVLTGAEEVPPVTTNASAVASFTLNPNGTLSFELGATGPIQQATAAHIHLGAYKQNGPVSVTLFSSSATNFQSGDMIASGTLTNANVGVIAGGIAALVERMRQGRAYVNLHTTANPGGEVRGQIHVIDREPVSHYSDPEFSWKFEVAPAGLGFINGRALGPQYDGDMIVGAARDFLFSGQLFRFNLTGNRRMIGVDDPALADRVADNTAKFDETESESLLFGTHFGVGTDIQTGPNGNLFVVSLSHGTIYEIFRRTPGQN